MKRRAKLSTSAQSGFSTTAPTVVFLGASNLTRALGTVYTVAQEICAGPGHYFIATGHGRSYGMYSRVMGRGLPGIIQSGIWQALDRHPIGGKIYALLTDVGNDLAYDQTPEQIVEWITVCLDRLGALQAEIVMTALPLESLESLEPARFLFYRTLLFPRNRLSLATILTRARELNAALQQLAGARGIPMVDQPLTWFGADPVHIRRREFGSAYRSVLRPWLKEANADAQDEGARLPVTTRLQLATAAPEWQDILLWRYRRPQPNVRLRDGSVIAFY